jgi:hypothetical protein
LLLLALVLAICGGPAPAVAHDIGVSRAELIERQGHRYVLSVQAGPALADRFPAPLLPKQCGFAGNPRGTQGAGWRSFEFTCEQGLTASDDIDLPWRRDGIMLTAKWRDGSTVKRLFRNEAGVIAVPLSELRAGSGSWLDAAKRYTALGVEHILLGIDHLLFVLCLLLIVRGPWMLVKTITAFTIAHSFTLGLATLGIVHIPTRPVEAAIALSIVFLAAEILHARQGRIGLTYQNPWAVALGFGLLHGLGFAGALSEIGLPQSEIPVALLFFNVGVEIGQLLFVLAFLLLRRALASIEFRWPQAVQLMPVYLVGTVATYWLLQRIDSIISPVAG